jgi:hypothetical protein
VTTEQESHEAWIKRLCPVAIGDDHYIGHWPWTREGQESTDDIMWAHRCNVNGNRLLMLARIDVTTGERHQIISGSLDGGDLTVRGGSGSILCVMCQDHGYITNGKWVKA